eukprot:Nk52_evm29s234 gene=Nk52_evmTU29s234
MSAYSPTVEIDLCINMENRCMIRESRDIGVPNIVSQSDLPVFVNQCAPRSQNAFIKPVVLRPAVMGNSNSRPADSSGMNGIKFSCKGAFSSPGSQTRAIC